MRDRDQVLGVSHLLDEFRPAVRRAITAIKDNIVPDEHRIEDLSIDVVILPLINSDPLVSRKR